MNEQQNYKMIQQGMCPACKERVVMDTVDLNDVSVSSCTNCGASYRNNHLSETSESM